MSVSPGHPRRTVLIEALSCAGLVLGGRSTWSADASSGAAKPERRWYEAAAAMKRLAESSGDQPYGAVLVANGAIIGEAPSRVVARGDATAHAEREAIRDAQRALGRTSLAGSVLYSTSKPCRACEIAAAQAQVTRMIFGEALEDAGPPRP